MTDRIGLALAPIEMLRSNYPAVELVANPDFAEWLHEHPDARVPVSIDLDKLQIRDIDGGPEFTVVLGVTLNWKGAEVAPFHRARVEGLGHFRFIADLDEDTAYFQKSRSAPSILYSSIREYLKILTANSPYGRLILPPIVIAPSR